MTAAHGDRDQDERHERHERPRPRAPTSSDPTTVLVGREVRDERVEVGVRLPREATVKALLELVARQPSLQMLLAENARDGLALAVANP